MIGQLLTVDFQQLLPWLLFFFLFKRSKQRSDGRERAAVIRFVFVTGMPSGVMARQKLFLLLLLLNVAQLIGVLRLITIYSGSSRCHHAVRDGSKRRPRSQEFFIRPK